jgi:hypothetical protein
MYFKLKTIHYTKRGRATQKPAANISVFYHEKWTPENEKNIDKFRNRDQTVCSETEVTKSYVFQHLRQPRA